MEISIYNRTNNPSVVKTGRHKLDPNNFIGIYYLRNIDDTTRVYNNKFNISNCPILLNLIGGIFARTDRWPSYWNCVPGRYYIWWLIGWPMGWFLFSIWYEIIAQKAHSEVNCLGLNRHIMELRWGIARILSKCIKIGTGHVVLSATHLEFPWGVIWNL